MSGKFDELFIPSMNHWDFLIAQIKGIEMCETDEDREELARAATDWEIAEINDPNRPPALC